MIISIKELETDQQVQLRKRWVDQSTVQAYVEALASGAKFPPVVVFYDGKTYWLADGFHRIAAYRFVGQAEIETEVHEGNKQSAMIYAATANVTNGKPMSQAEKREAGKRLLKMTDWSDREIARRLAVSQPTVGNWHNSLSDKSLSDTPHAVTVNRSGTTYEMNVANIGKPPLPQITTLQPNMLEPITKPLEYETVEEAIEEIDKGCHNCLHCESDASSDWQYWCHAMGRTIRVENDPICKLELWQDGGQYLEDIAQALQQVKNTDQPEFPPSIELLTGDFAQIGPQLPSESFDLIITDPPYGADNIHLYELLAAQAVRLLRPGGSLLAMAGQLCIPQTLNAMTKYLTYHWTISYDTPGGQSPQIWPRKVNSFWKPIFWFVKGKYDGTWHGDKIKSDVNDNDKRFHKWGQSESGMGKLVSEFASVGTGKVLDPFVGGGTLAVVCYRLRIPFVGIDISAEAINTTRERILLEMTDAGS